MIDLFYYKNVAFWIFWEYFYEYGIPCVAIKFTYVITVMIML